MGCGPVSPHRRRYRTLGSDCLGAARGPRHSGSLWHRIHGFAGWGRASRGAPGRTCRGRYAVSAATAPRRVRGGRPAGPSALILSTTAVNCGLSALRPGPANSADDSVAVGLVRRKTVGLLAGPARADLWNADLVQHLFELGAVRPLSRCDDQGQRATSAVGAQVEFAGEPAPRAAQALTSCTTSTRRACRLCHAVSPWCSACSAPFEAGTGGGSVRAPAAC